MLTAGIIVLAGATGRVDEAEGSERGEHEHMCLPNPVVAGTVRQHGVVPRTPVESTPEVK